MNGKVRLELADEISIHLTVNGNAVSSSEPSNLSLMRFLRDELGLTGTKNGCNTGHCGACTVIVGGKATRACLVRMSKLNGARIQTIEGLAQNGNLHPIQLAFIEHGAVQCGFCTPGMIMATKALLDAKPHPTHAEIKKALTQNNNLCAVGKQAFEGFDEDIDPLLPHFEAADKTDEGHFRDRQL